ncbi:MAG: CPBP family glutamic-type intramembrane protease [Aquisalinus sp.]|nr:CPBP family glutamic-type intramembrane protease [Aquisalinus sp.]
MPLTGINHDSDFSNTLRQAFAWPDMSVWREAILLLCLFSLLAVPFGLHTGLLIWQPSLDGLLPVMLVAFFAPALLEEVVFRGPLLLPQKKGRKLFMAAILLFLFVLWHPLNGTFLMTTAGVLFTDLRFLGIAFGLGLVCTVATLRSGSLWPAVLIHWLVVVSWKGLFGGPQFLTGST